MTNVLPIRFDSFQRLAKNHRIYYYVGEEYYDFVFLVDGTFVKTTVLKVDIPNQQQFFSDKLFYGAEEMTFRIPYPKEDLDDIDGIKMELEKPIIIQNIQDLETKNEDIQRTGNED